MSFGSAVAGGDRGQASDLSQLLEQWISLEESQREHVARTSLASPHRQPMRYANPVSPPQVRLTSRQRFTASATAVLNAERGRVGCASTTSIALQQLAEAQADSQRAGSNVELLQLTLRRERVHVGRLVCLLRTQRRKHLVLATWRDHLRSLSNSKASVNSAVWEDRMMCGPIEKGVKLRHFRGWLVVLRIEASHRRKQQRAAELLTGRMTGQCFRCWSEDTASVLTLRRTLVHKLFGRCSGILLAATFAAWATTVRGRKGKEAAAKSEAHDALVEAARKAALAAGLTLAENSGGDAGVLYLLKCRRRRATATCFVAWRGVAFPTDEGSAIITLTGEVQRLQAELDDKEKARAELAETLDLLVAEASDVERLLDVALDSKTQPPPAVQVPQTVNKDLLHVLDLLMRYIRKSQKGAGAVGPSRRRHRRHADRGAGMQSPQQTISPELLAMTLGRTMISPGNDSSGHLFGLDSSGMN
jgi:hypothetical protein